MTREPVDLSAEVAAVEEALLARWPESRVAPSLERIGRLMTYLGDPQRSFPVIHIAGTNGKTSTARMIDSLLSAFGLRVGRYTSPHLESMSERISLEGMPIEPQRFIDTYADIAPYLELVDAELEVPLTFFETITAMAYVAFADAPVDIAVVECGLGGEWDATNIADGQVAVITPIGLDHMEYLGGSVEEIARTKAGIIKPAATAILAHQPVAAATELLQRAVSVAAPVAREGMEFGVRQREVAVGGQLLSLQGLHGEYEEVYLPLHGEHQAHNAAVALAAVEAFLGGADGAQLSLDSVRAGFASARSPGRLEVVRRSPTIVLDAAHNPHGAAALAAAIEEAFTFETLVGVVAAMADKDVRGVLEALEPVLHEVVVTASASARAMSPAQLFEIAEEVFGTGRVHVENSLGAAIETAITLAEADAGFGSGVLVTGSVVTVGQARALLKA
jgi:dihydrofolate synthase/folylpolyglutamate synthase